MFFNKIANSKKLSSGNREEWPEELKKSYDDFRLRGFSKLNAIVIDYIFHKVKKIEIEEMPFELIKSKEKEMVQKFKPPFNSQTASEEYYRLYDEGGIED